MTVKFIWIIVVIIVFFEVLLTTVVILYALKISDVFQKYMLLFITAKDYNFKSCLDFSYVIVSQHGAPFINMV